MLLQAGHVDAALVGGAGDWWQHMTYVLPIIPKRENVGRVYALSALIIDNGTLFFCDTHVNVDPTAEQVAEMTLLAAESVRRFGLTPKAALLSHSSFGAQQLADRPQDARGPGPGARARLSWRSTARCTPTPPSPRPCATAWCTTAP